MAMRVQVNDLRSIWTKLDIGERIPLAATAAPSHEPQQDSIAPQPLTYKEAFGIVHLSFARTEGILDLETVRAAITTLAKVEGPGVKILQAMHNWAMSWDAMMFH
ncbi:hypothetical protein H2201_007685 [Coniosporium apollinis]|uniref:Uncharacterized protein n=1 Tax=Coniosporium apollinis TaxID=61459 RepID=A0ABQ9NKA5_9PEZI|nr:hypothetical protein H2201_007685 [Coniosporium apollinis]